MSTEESWYKGSFEVVVKEIIANELGVDPEKVTDIGTRRELFVENTLISSLGGGARLQLHRIRLLQCILRTQRLWLPSVAE